MFRIRFSSLLWAVAIGAAAPACAQVPAVSFAFPPGGQIGNKTTVTISGGNLQGATAVLVSGTGVQAQIVKNADAGSLPIELTVAPNVAPGMREIRVVTPRGSSNPGRIWVGAYPQLTEVEPNNSLATAQKIDKLPVTITGQVNGGEDADFYSFQAAAGDTYVFDLNAARMVSALDGFLALYDAKGKILQSSMEGFERDPRIIHTFKTAGTYVVQVRDSMYRGGGNFVYDLTMGKIPAVTGYFPLGGKRGQTVNVNLEGVNLGDRKTLPVQMPMDRDDVAVAVPTSGGMAPEPVQLQASELNQVTESEPNDAPAQAQSIPSLPVVIDGRIDKPGDIDLYRIKPAAAGTMAFEVFGRRIGSRIDSFLRILDANGKELQANDDAEGKDSRIVFGVAANTEYLVEVRTLDRRSGGDVFYRLQIAPPGGQDFRLTLSPTELNVGQSGSVAVTATVTRVNGFGGPVELKVDGLPAGITASPATIPAGGGSAMFTLTAAPGAAPGAMGQIRVLGTGTIDGKPVIHEAVPTEVYKQPLAADGQNSSRPVHILPATVMGQQAYALDIEPKAISVKKGGSVQIKVKSIRSMGVTQQINLTVAGQPANVNPALQNINANANEATITLNVAGNAPTVTQNVVISGNLNNNVQAAPAFTLTITD